MLASIFNITRPNRQRLSFVLELVSIDNWTVEVGLFCSRYKPTMMSCIYNIRILKTKTHHKTPCRGKKNLNRQISLNQNDLVHLSALAETSASAFLLNCTLVEVSKFLSTAKLKISFYGELSSDFACCIIGSIFLVFGLIAVQSDEKTQHKPRILQFSESSASWRANNKRQQQQQQ